MAIHKKRRKRGTDDEAHDSIAYFRAEDRFFRSADGQWCYSTRKGERGPFATRELAEIDLASYLVTIETGLELELAPDEDQPKRGANF